MMRFATVVQPSGVHQDWSDEDATLVYDVPERELDDLLLSIDVTDTDAVPRATAQGLGGAHIVMTVVAALLGAMAAAWSIEVQAPGAAPTAQALVSELGKLWRPDHHARRALPAARPSAPARAVVAEPAALVEAAAPVEPVEPVAAAEPAAAVAAIAEPAAVAAPAEPELAEATAKAAPARRTNKTAARSRSSRRIQSRPAPVRPEPAAAAMAVAPSSDASRTGVLRINSRPWSQVYVDGRPIGATPQTAIELQPGRHRVELISDEFDMKRTLTVKVRAGETITRSVELLQ
jgi:hypothetical protein